MQTRHYGLNFQKAVSFHVKRLLFLAPWWWVLGGGCSVVGTRWSVLGGWFLVVGSLWLVLGSWFQVHKIVAEGVLSAACPEK